MGLNMKLSLKNKKEDDGKVVWKLGRTPEQKQEKLEQKQEKLEQKEKQEKYVPSKLRFGRRLTKKELKILLIPALAAVAAVVVAIFAFNNGSTYKFEQNGMQYYANKAISVPAGSKMTLNSESETILDNSGVKGEIDIPVYVEAEDKIVLPTDMACYAPRDNSVYAKIPAFSEIQCKANGMVSIMNGGKSITPKSGFMHNGEDIYIFLEDMDIEFDSQRVSVPALSYAEVIYGGYIMIFNYETKECTVENPSGIVTARRPSGDYTISLYGDSYTNYEGKKVLLFARPNLLDSLI